MIQYLNKVAGCHLKEQLALLSIQFIAGEKLTSFENCRKVWKTDSQPTYPHLLLCLKHRFLHQAQSRGYTPVLWLRDQAGGSISMVKHAALKIWITSIQFLVVPLTCRVNFCKLLSCLWFLVCKLEVVIHLPQGRLRIRWDDAREVPSKVPSTW